MNSNFLNPAIIGGIHLKNVCIRSATHEGMADEYGRPTEQLTQLYCQLARGGVGAIITGFAGIQQDGRSPFYRMLMADSDESIPAFARLVQRVHEYETPIILQIAHCGLQTRSKATGLPKVAPSHTRSMFYNEDVHVLTEAEIETVILNFVACIVRAKNAGFDGVQIHAAHGYLLSQFLSPYYNRRTDAWGGTTEKRFRIVKEIIMRARALVGDFPLWIKLNAHDHRQNGMRIGEAVAIARLLEQVGCSAIEVSCGVIDDGAYTARNQKNPVDALFAFDYRFSKMPKVLKHLFRLTADLILPPARPLKNYNVSAAQDIKAAVSIDVIVVGGVHSLDDIASIIKRKQADAVALSRPLIIEPNLIRKFKEGQQCMSRCILCNYCIIAQQMRPLQCYYGNIK